jgi:hypothetical protein
MMKKHRLLVVVSALVVLAALLAEQAIVWGS